jgi:hypothetical protein
MTLRISCGLWLALGLLAAAATPAAAQGYEGYPNTIMAPEPGTAGHNRSAAPRRARHMSNPQPEKPLATEQPVHRNLHTARGSSGSVLPTPLPRTQLIPPEGGGIVMTHSLPHEQGPTVLPGGAAIPNLSHGPETFQDRASRCSFQQGLYGVPGSASTQYMGACIQ